MRAAAAAGLAAAMLSACMGEPPVRQDDGSLASCADVNQCVSSQSQDAEHRVEPLRYAGSTEAAHQRLLGIVMAMPRVHLVVNVPNYVHVEMKSVTGHLDDFEFLFSAIEARIDLRAASRGGSLGSDDNRGRLEAVRAAFAGS